MNYFTRLASIASPPLTQQQIDPAAIAESLKDWGEVGRQLLQGLSNKNGFYAFESALLIRPLSSDAPPLGILEWNAPTLWKGEYAMELTNALFFAEDAFGFQFGIVSDKIKSFDPETGKYEDIAESLESWAEILQKDYNYRTGWSLAHDWQIKNGALQPGFRLLPKLPFFCGGPFTVDNLYASEEVQGMRFRASTFNQIRELPEGSDVVFRIKSDPDTSKTP